MPSFDFVVVGCGGGPFESNLSAYLFKAAHSTWKNQVVGLEAGSGMGALDRILRDNPGLFGMNPDTDKPYTAAQIYSFLRCYLISHSHLDHISSLVISAGSFGGQKRIYARDQTLRDLETVFADRIWPNLASYKKDAMLRYSSLPADHRYMEITPGISVRSMPLNHGVAKTLGVYESAAFFVRNDTSCQEFLFFGDVQPDGLSTDPQTINVWKTAAPKIPTTLSTIFIECSWPFGRDDDLLFGHLSPEHLVDELVVLATEVYGRRNTGKSNGPSTRGKQRLNPISLRGVLNGLFVYVMHCKDDVGGSYDQPINRVIADQVRSLVEHKGLGANIIAVEQGMHISI